MNRLLHFLPQHLEHFGIVVSPQWASRLDYLSQLPPRLKSLKLFPLFGIGRPMRFPFQDDHFQHLSSTLTLLRIPTGLAPAIDRREKGMEFGSYTNLFVHWSQILSSFSSCFR